MWYQPPEPEPASSSTCVENGRKRSPLQTRALQNLQHGPGSERPILPIASLLTTMPSSSFDVCGSHRLPEIVHPWQMGRPVHMSDIVEDESEQVIISHPVVEHVHEARYVTTIGDIEPLLLHIRLLSAPRHHRSDELTTSLRLSKEPHGYTRDCSSAKTVSGALSMLEE